MANKSLFLTILALFRWFERSSTFPINGSESNRCFSICEPEDQWQVQKQCFTFCEPEDLTQFRKLNHHIVDENQWFLYYTTPKEPEFNLNEVGEPGLLSPLIIAGNIEQAREKAVVQLDEYPWMESYAGFLTVNPKFNSNLYFWFFPSQNQPSEDPLIIWLQVGHSTVRTLTVGLEIHWTVK